MAGSKFLWSALVDIWDPDRRKPDQLNPQAQKRRDKVIERKGTITERISETTRSIAFGTLASCYALLIAKENVSEFFVGVRSPLLLAAIFALVAIMFDALQYVFGYVNIQQALAHPEQGYPKNWSRSGGQACFLIKQLFAYLAGLLLVASIAMAMR